LLGSDLINLPGRFERVQGTVNIAASGQTNWHSFATRIVEGLGSRANLPENVAVGDAVAHQQPGLCHFAQKAACRHSVVRSKRRKLSCTTREEAIASYEQRLWFLSCESRKRGVDLSRRAGDEKGHTEPKRFSGILNRLQSGICRYGVGGIYQNGVMRRLGQKLMHERKPLGVVLECEDIEARRVTAGMSEIRNKAQRDRVFTNSKYYRNRCRRYLGCERSRGRGRRRDEGNASANEISHKRRKTPILAIEPVVLHRHVLAFDISQFAETFAKSRSNSRPPLRATGC
jgi:hypothetical protein